MWYFIIVLWEKYSILFLKSLVLFVIILCFWTFCKEETYFKKYKKQLKNTHFFRSNNGEKCWKKLGKTDFFEKQTIMHLPTRNTSSAAPEREKTHKTTTFVDRFWDTKFQLFRVFWWTHVTVCPSIKTCFTRDMCVSTSCKKLHIFAVFDQLKVEQKCALRDLKTQLLWGSRNGLSFQHYQVSVIGK